MARESRFDRTPSRRKLTTFRLVWNWAVEQGYLKGPAPVKGVKFPKGDESLPFMTFDEIRRIIDRGGLSPEKEGRLWDCLFLTKTEVEDVLEHVRTVGRTAVHLPHVRHRRPHGCKTQRDTPVAGGRLRFLLPNRAYPGEEEEPREGDDIPPRADDPFAG